MLFIEPHAGPAPVIQVIRSARHTVDLSVYYLAYRPILDALRAAHARGVDVRVILDERPFGLKPRQVQKEYREAVATGAVVHWAPARFEAVNGRYAYFHNKYVCNGHEAEVGSANMDYSAFHRNREYLYVTTNGAVVHALHAVFQADWTGTRAGPGPRRALVLSPGSEPDLAAVIGQPGNVDIESEELGDDTAILDAIAAKGPLARVILPASISATDRRNVRLLEEHGVQIRLLPTRPIYLHAKLVAGSRYAFVGSQNFSVSSLNGNREVGILLQGRDTRLLRQQFHRDWVRAGHG